MTTANVTAADRARAAAALPRFEGELANVEERISGLRASCDAHVFDAHPEVRWLEGRCASLRAHISMLRAEAE